jgi:hypothetical protein
MIRILLLFGLVAVILVGIQSCTTEDELLEPTTVDLKIKMINPKPFKDLPPQANKKTIEFEGGTLRIASIKFNGDRENNDNYYFSKDFDQVVVADLANNSLNQQVTFDIPRGVYNPVKITLETSGTESIPGLKLRGKFKNKGNGPPDFVHGGKKEIPVEFDFFNYNREEIELTLNTEAGVGEEQIVFDGDNWNTLEIRINLAHLFRKFNPGLLERAEIQGQGENQRIVVSRSQNNKEEIYFNLVNRVDKSIKAVIK